MQLNVDHKRRLNSYSTSIINSRQTIKNPITWGTKCTPSAIVIFNELSNTALHCIAHGLGM